MFRHSVKLWLFSLLIITASRSKSQEYIGLRIDNYAGSNGMLLNPATPMSGALPWDVNIVAAGFSANNNYIYAIDHNTITMIGAIGDKVETEFYAPKKVYAYEQGFVQLPSGFVRINDFAVGLFFTARNAGYLKSENYQPGMPSYDTIFPGVPTDFPEFTAGMINWTEIGVNGEFALIETTARAIYVGANIKYLMGFDGMDFSNNQLFTYTEGQSTSTVTSTDMDFSYSTNFGSNAMSDKGNYKINGSGLGMDAGVFYLVKSGDYSEQYALDYSWKFGASLVDLGYVHFKRNSGDYQLTSAETATISNASIDSIDDLDEFNLTGSRNFYDNADASQTGADFNMLLPAAITLSADRNLGGGFFVNGLIVRRMPHLNSNLIARPNTIAVSPRFEKRWFGITIPVVLYEDKFLHLGTAARLGFLTIGSDNILSWFVKDDYTGTDIYAGIKINPVWLSGAGGSNGGGGKSAKQLECPKM